MRGRFSASPILANDLIYFFNEDTLCTIIKPDRKFEIIAENELAEGQLMATPAFDENSIYIRTAKKPLSNKERINFNQLSLK
jgi:hypothetical protein